jgi:hypothetical protein
VYLLVFQVVFEMMLYLYPQTRTTTETVLRETTMQALLARTVVEIRAADIAVELEPQL